MSGHTATILIVEDEPSMVQGLRDAFEHHGYRVQAAADGEAGLELGLAGQADLILLDVMLPRRDGMSVCRELRRRNVRVPIIMLTALGEEPDRIIGLETGADDYVPKPFSMQELVARVRAQLRRESKAGGDVARVHIGKAVVDFKQYTVFNGAARHALTHIEAALLRLFAGHPHEVMTRERLLNEIWGYTSFPTTRTIDTFMLRLRQKIEADPHRPEHFLTVHGVGYRFVP